MKKILFVFVAAFAIESVYSIAHALAVRTTCGKAVTTVGPEFFEDRHEFELYMYALNDTHCGVSKMPRVIHN